MYRCCGELACRSAVVKPLPPPPEPLPLPLLNDRLCRVPVPWVVVGAGMRSRATVLREDLTDAVRPERTVLARPVLPREGCLRAFVRFGFVIPGFVRTLEPGNPVLSDFDHREHLPLPAPVSLLAREQPGRMHDTCHVSRQRGMAHEKFQERACQRLGPLTRRYALRRGGGVWPLCRRGPGASLGTGYGATAAVLAVARALLSSASTARAKRRTASIASSSLVTRAGSKRIVLRPEPSTHRRC